MENIALVPAAGRGIRMYPLTRKTPKTMAIIDGKPILQYNLEILRDQLNVKEVYIIIGEQGEQIQDYFRDGSDLNLQITYILQKDQKGIGHAVGLGEEYIDRPFFVILGDEMYINTNHRDILPLFREEFNALCTFMKTPDRRAISKNYTAEIKGNEILSLSEKPKLPSNNLLGVGTYAFDPIIFEYIKKTPPSLLRNEIEITDVIDTLARKESKVYAFFLEGYYTNINTVEDLNSAVYQWRSSHFDTYAKSLVIPAHNEAESIGKVIEDFIDSVSEILVVDNNSTDETARIARKHNAVVVSEPAQGYGNALKCGMNNAKGDILVITEADASFKSKDLTKILEHLKNADMVVGTRTSKQLIEDGANMDLFLRWGNMALGKAIELLWWNKRCRFTDVGCTYRGLWKEAYKRIRDNLKSEGPEFSVEMMIEVLKADMKVIEMPVTYYQRYGGESKHSASRTQSFCTGLKMISVILRKLMK